MFKQPNVEMRLAGILAGKRREIGRAITDVENETNTGRQLMTAISPHVGRAHVVGITGPGGAGKSTLVNALIGELGERGRNIGVIAVDPSSPVSGGALLGDRIRMLEHAASDTVFIRSVAARGHQGGLSLSAGRIVDVFDASGMDTIIVETLGAGQAELDVCKLADTRIFVCPPGLGDDVQSMKAGILELADVLVVSKADLPQADQLAQSLLNMLARRPKRDWMVPVICTVAITGDGIGFLVDTINAHASFVGKGLRHKAADSNQRGILAQLASNECRRQIGNCEDEEMNMLCATLESAEIGHSDTLAKVFALLARRMAAGQQADRNVNSIHPQP